MKKSLNATRNTLRVAAVQMKFAHSIEGNLAKIEQAASHAAAAGADAVLFPECATTGYGYDFGSLRPTDVRKCLQTIGRIAAAQKTYLLVGSPVFAGRRLFNGMTVFDRDGRLVHVYAKCQLTASDRVWFSPGNSLSLFLIDGVWATAIICHERRYPELVRLAVMAGAQILFHPNAGMDLLSVSKSKRGGRDGIAVRAFENAIYYVFANSVGPQGQQKWSAGDTKIVAPDGSLVQLADNEHEANVSADLDLSLATRKYAIDSLEHPEFLAKHWRGLLREVQQRVVETDRRFLSWYGQEGEPQQPSRAAR